MISRSAVSRQDFAEKPPNRPSPPLQVAPQTEGAVAAPFPPGVGQLVALLRSDLKGVEFPGFGAAALEQATARLDECARAVQAARAELARAEAELAAEREALTALADQGLAYLRVYARGRSELADKLSAIKLKSAAPAPTRQRRPRRPRESPHPTQGQPQQASG
jgi:hypothetical protein